MWEGGVERWCVRGAVYRDVVCWEKGGGGVHAIQKRIENYLQKKSSRGRKACCEQLLVCLSKVRHVDTVVWDECRSLQYECLL